MVRIIIILLLCFSCSAAAQEITFHVLDGRNGRAMKNARVDVWLGTAATGVPIQLKTSEQGIARLGISPGHETFVTAGEWVKDCRGTNKPGKSYIDANVYRFADAIEHGIAAQNACGKATAQPKPGEFILFVRPLHWWERMRE
jgi:hypothetical protein